MEDNKLVDKLLKVVGEAGYQKVNSLNMSNNKDRCKLFVWILKRQPFGNEKLFENLNEFSPKEKIIEGFKYLGIAVNINVLKGKGSDQEQQEFLQCLIVLTDVLKHFKNKLKTKKEQIMDIIQIPETTKKLSKQPKNEDEFVLALDMEDDESFTIESISPNHTDDTKFVNLESKLRSINEEFERFDSIAVENMNHLVNNSEVVDKCLSGIGKNFIAVNEVIQQRINLESETANMIIDRNDVVLNLDVLGQLVDIVADETSQVVNFVRPNE